MKRCEWCGDDPLYVDYHDNEWGIPQHDDQKLFEMLILEGAQAGLSWITILRKRENYRVAFEGFDPELIACYDEAKFEELMNNAGLVRNRLKIQATITNAQAYLNILEAYDSFDSYIWQFVDGQPIINQWGTLSELPTDTAESKLMSKTLKNAGFKFVGSTICYAFMQATGMVNDHTMDCFRHDALR